MGLPGESVRKWFTDATDGIILFHQSPSLLMDHVWTTLNYHEFNQVFGPLISKQIWMGRSQVLLDEEKLQRVTWDFKDQVWYLNNATLSAQEPSGCFFWGQVWFMIHFLLFFRQKLSFLMIFVIGSLRWFPMYFYCLMRARRFAWLCRNKQINLNKSGSKAAFVPCHRKWGWLPSMLLYCFLLDFKDVSHKFVIKQLNSNSCTYIKYANNNLKHVQQNCATSRTNQQISFFPPDLCGARRAPHGSHCDAPRHQRHRQAWR